MAETYRCGPIPRTMAEVEAENAQLRRENKLLLDAMQDRTAYLRQMVEGCERTLRAWGR